MFTLCRLRFHFGFQSTGTERHPPAPTARRKSPKCLYWISLGDAKRGRARIQDPRVAVQFRSLFKPASLHAATVSSHVPLSSARGGKPAPARCCSEPARRAALYSIHANRPWACALSWRPDASAGRTCERSRGWYTRAAGMPLPVRLPPAVSASARNRSPCDNVRRVAANVQRAQANRNDIGGSRCKPRHALRP
jgi:hypothetical protein